MMLMLLMMMMSALFHEEHIVDIFGFYGSLFCVCWKCLVCVCVVSWCENKQCEERQTCCNMCVCVYIMHSVCAV